MQTNPVTATVVADLLSMGVNPSSLKFMVLGFESDKWITIKDGGVRSFIILSLILLENRAADYYRCTGQL